jgi:hypothetical protein
VENFGDPTREMDMSDGMFTDHLQDLPNIMRIIETRIADSTTDDLLDRSRDYAVLPCETLDAGEERGWDVDTTDLLETS